MWRGGAGHHPGLPRMSHSGLDELRNECRVSRDGSNASTSRSGEKYGLISKGLRMTADKFEQLGPPFVVFWEPNHVW